MLWFRGFSCHCREAWQALHTLRLLAGRSTEVHLTHLRLAPCEVHPGQASFHRLTPRAWGRRADDYRASLGL